MWFLPQQLTFRQVVGACRLKDTMLQVPLPKGACAHAVLENTGRLAGPWSVFQHSDLCSKFKVLEILPVL